MSYFDINRLKTKFTANQSTPRFSRLKVLDLLRAIAVFLVLGRHMIPFPSNYPEPIRSISEHWIVGGWIGVDLFFVLSGFLISGLLFKEYLGQKTINFKKFFIRRGFKIYPAFYFFIILTIIGTYLTHFGPSISGLWSELFFYQSYQQGLWPHTWSLAVEEHFYLLLPLLLIALYKIRSQNTNPFNVLPKIFILIAIIIIGLRFFTAYTYPFGEWRDLYPTHLRIDSLFFGTLLSYYYHFSRERFVAFFNKNRKILGMIAILFLSPTFFYDLDKYIIMHTIGYTFFYIAFGIILGLAVANDHESPKIIDRILQPVYFIGSRSYSIYLWHFPFKLWGLWIIQKMFATQFDPMTLFLVYFIGSFLMGITMASIIEIPALRLREKLFPTSPLKPLPQSLETVNYSKEKIEIT